MDAQGFPHHSQWPRDTPSFASANGIALSLGYAIAGGGGGLVTRLTWLVGARLGGKMCVCLFTQKKPLQISFWLFLALGDILRWGSIWLGVLLMSDTSDKTTIPLLGFKAVRKSPRRRRSKKFVEQVDCQTRDSCTSERVVVSDSDVQLAFSETKEDGEQLGDYRGGYETEPISPRTPPSCIANGESKLATPKAPKKKHSSAIDRRRDMMDWFLEGTYAMVW